MGERKKKTFGPSGSQISDDYWTYNLRIKVPPIRIPPDELDVETFKEMLKSQEDRADAIQRSRRENIQEMTKELFFEILSDPLAKQRRQARTAKQRMVQALEYFQRIDEDVWLNEQMQILRHIDNMRKQQDKEAYGVWKKLFMERVQKTYKAIVVAHGIEKAKAFAEFAWTFMEDKKPKDIQPFTKIVRRRIRQLALRTDTEAMMAFSEEMHLIIAKKVEEHKKTPRKPRKRRKKKGLPDGKIPFPEKDKT